MPGASPLVGWGSQKQAFCGAGDCAGFAYAVPRDRHSAGVSGERLSVSSPDDAANKASETAQVFMALPSPAEDSRAVFSHCLTVLVNLLGADIGTEESGTREWRRKARTVIRTGLDGRETVPDQFFDALIRAGIYDPVMSTLMR